MKKLKIFTALSVFLLVVLACNFVMPESTSQPSTAVPQLTVITEPTSSPRTDLPRDENAVPRVSLEQALTALNAGAAIFVDVNNDGLLDLFVSNVGIYTSNDRGLGGYFRALPDAFQRSTTARAGRAGASFDAPTAHPR